MAGSVLCRLAALSLLPLVLQAQVNIGDSPKDPSGNSVKDSLKESAKECLDEFKTSIIGVSSHEDICSKVTEYVTCVGKNEVVKRMPGKLSDNVSKIAGAVIEEYSCDIDVEEVVRVGDSAAGLSSLSVLNALLLALATMMLIQFRD